MQCGDKGYRTARNNVEHRVPGVVALLARLRRRGIHVLQKLRQIKAGREVHAVTEDHGFVGLVTTALDRSAQLHDDIVVDGVALVGTVQTDDRDRAFEFIGNEFRRGHWQISFATTMEWGSTAATSARARLSDAFQLRRR